ncbi:MAG TPA: twin-arginine translocase TatA/TatE family subunit [Abditibacteriaceae bacterium]|jgi:sec-independent protein translocase protein TatA
MPSLGAGELIVIFVLVLVLFGPNRLPELARGLGKGMREIRKVTSEFQSQLSLLADDEDEKKAATVQSPRGEPTRLDQIKWEPDPDVIPPDDAPEHSTVEPSPESTDTAASADSSALKSQEKIHD